MKIDTGEPVSTFEPATEKTLSQISVAVNKRLTPSNECLDDPNLVSYVLNAGKKGYPKGTEVNLLMGEKNISIVFLEPLYEVNSRREASYLAYGYFIVSGKMQLVVQEDLSGKAEVVKARVGQLKRECIDKVGDDGRRAYYPTEPHARRVLATIK